MESKVQVPQILCLNKVNVLCYFPPLIDVKQKDHPTSSRC